MHMSAHTFYDFKQDFPIAQRTEREVGEILEQRYQGKVMEYGKTNKYDILFKTNTRLLKFEVKEDFTCEKTGNVGVEFECRGKPSGIQVSEADFYIYKVHSQYGDVRYFLCSTKCLKKMIADKEYFRIVTGGDPGSNSKNYLFKYETFIRNFKIIAVALDKSWELWYN